MRIDTGTVKAIQNATTAITEDVGKVIIGKDEVIRKVLMSIMANGHILLDDVPGVGKTSLAVAFGKALGLNYNRIQFTPDVLPSDIVGFSVFNKDRNSFTYMPGVINDTNLLLADEIYTRYVFEGEFIPLITLPGMRERTICCSSLSKTFTLAL